MRLSRRLLFKISVYFAYALLLTAVLLVLRFPHEKLRGYLIHSVENRFPETQCEIERVGYQFPVGLKVHNLLVKSSGNSQQILKIDDIVVQPELSNPVGSFALKIDAYEQEHVAQLGVDWKRGEVLIQEFKINKLDLSQFQYIHNRLGREFSGLMNISGTFSGLSEKEGLGIGKGKIAVVDSEVKLLLPILFQDVIDFEKIETTYTIKNKTIEFDNGRFKGSKIKGDFAGKAQILQKLVSTRLDLNGKLIPQAGVLKNNPQATAEVNRLKRQFKNPAFPFVIEGEVGKPVFGFSN